MGVIICNWWRKVQKIGIFANQNAYFTGLINMETPNTQDFRHKNSYSLSIFMQNTPKTWEIRWDFSEKSGKLALFSIELTPNLTIWVENSEKSDFSVKQVWIFKHLFLQIVTCGYILAQKLKQLFYHTKIEVVILHKLYLTQTSTIIVENTENLH